MALKLAPFFNYPPMDNLISIYSDKIRQTWINGDANIAIAGKTTSVMQSLTERPREGKSPPPPRRGSGADILKKYFSKFIQLIKIAGDETNFTKHTSRQPYQHSFETQVRTRPESP